MKCKVQDLNLDPVDAGWQTLNACIHKGNMNVALVEASFKVYSMWCVVAERLSKFFPGISPSSFWGCGHPFITDGQPSKVRRFWGGGVYSFKYLLQW